MKAQLISHNFPNDPNWIIVNPSVPLGTIYEILDYVESGFVLVNHENYVTKEVPVYYLYGNGGSEYLPTCLFKVIES